MDKLQTQESQLANTTIDKDFVQQLYHVNYLTNYPISDAMLEGWSKSIKELAPEMTSKTVKIIIDRMKVGTIDFDNRIGIQNIFKAYKIILNEYLVDLSRLETTEERNNEKVKVEIILRRYAKQSIMVR